MKAAAITLREVATQKQVARLNTGVPKELTGAIVCRIHQNTIDVRGQNGAILSGRIVEPYSCARKDSIVIRIRIVSRRHYCHQVIDLPRPKPCHHHGPVAVILITQ